MNDERCFLVGKFCNQCIARPGCDEYSEYLKAVDRVSEKMEREPIYLKASEGKVSMNLCKVTEIVVIITILALVGWDIYVAIQPGTCTTISCIVLSWTYKYPILNFACGVLCGHLFWPQHIKNNKVID